MPNAGLLYDPHISNLLGINCPEEDANYINTITADQAPDYDQYGPDCYWEGKHWVRSHQLKVAKYGKTIADQKFAADWQKRSAFGHELWIANNDVEFRNYVVAQGLNKTVPDLAMIQGTGQAVQTAVDVAGSAADVVKNAADAAVNATDAANTLISWLPWIVLGAIAVVGYLMITQKKVNVL